MRRALVNGYEAIALTDHVDASNIDFVLPRVVKAAKELNKFWKIKVLPGVELSHVPLQDMQRLIRFARKGGAKIIVVHGETISEPVLPGTNRKAIEYGADILAHPGHISLSDAKLAAQKGVYLEITTRKSHRVPNKEVIRMAKKAGARLVLNTDTHRPEDIINDKKAVSFLKKLNLTQADIKNIFRNSRELIAKTKNRAKIP